MVRTRSSLIILMAALTLGCEAPEVGDATLEGDAAPATERAAVPADAADTEAEVARIREAWVEAAEAGDAATVASFYAEDARMVDASGDVADGRDAIRETLAPGFEAMSDLEVTSTGLVIGTDVVSDMGTYTQILRTPEGQEQTVNGSYVVVLQRQPDGAWRIVHHLSSAPAQSEAEGM